MKKFFTLMLAFPLLLLATEEDSCPCHEAETHTVSIAQYPELRRRAFECTFCHTWYILEEPTTCKNCGNTQFYMMYY